MQFKEGTDEEAARAITSLVDRSLRHGDRRLADAWFGFGEPPGSWLGPLRQEVESQRRVALALRTAGPPVPEKLVRAVEEQLGIERR